METDNLKSVWQSIVPSQKSREDLMKMSKERSNAVLQPMRKQIYIELFGFVAFLFCYYSMFDGADKPLTVNLIIAIAIVLPIVNHLRGYQLQKQFKSGNNLKDDLTIFVNKLENFRVETIIARLVFTIGLMLFCTYNITFSVQKWWATALIVIMFFIQFFFLNKIWSNRISKLKQVLQELNNTYHR